MIHLENIGVVLNGRQVLINVTMHVPRGQMVCLFGPSGCGKTTVLNVVAGITAAREGSVRVQDVRLGYAFQDDRLAPWLTVADNMLLGLAGTDLPPSEAEERARVWLQRFGLEDAAGKHPAQLSGGMRRRVNLARAFSVQPDLLLLDEPFAFLDSAMVGTVRSEILQAHERGVTMLVVSHVYEHIAPLPARIVTVSGPPVSFTYDGAESAG